MPPDIKIGDLPTPANERSGWPWTEARPPLPAHMSNGALWPWITIVTPSYNQAEFLEETIRSVLLQGYPNLEYFIMDGGSTDKSVEIIQRYTPWLAGYVSERDRGQAHAINKGMAMATGAILTWLNSDDTYEPGALARIGQAFIDNPEAVLVFGKAYTMSRGGRRMGQASARVYDRRWLLEQGNSIPQPSAFFTRDAFRAVGSLDETLHFAMDSDLWFRLGDDGVARYLPEYLSNQRIYPEAKTSAGDHRYYREVRQVIGRYGGSGLPAELAEGLVNTHLPKAWEAYRSGDIVTGQTELSYVLENVPALRAEVRLAQEIARQSWAYSRGLTGKDTAGLVFAQRVCQHLPSGVARPGQLRRRVLAAIHKASAYRLFAQGERAEVWRRVGQALVHEPGYAKDRGLWSLTARSLLRPNSDGNWPIQLGPARQRLLVWLETLRGNRPAGEYGMRSGVGAASLESSAVVAQVRGLWGAPALRPDETAAWVEYLSTQQAECAPHPAGPSCNDSEEWHRTVLTIAALRSLGATYQAPLRYIDHYLTAPTSTAWLAGLNWAQAREASQQVRLLAVSLAQEHARTGEAIYWQALEVIGNWLAARVIVETGSWTFSQPITPIESLSNACNLAPLFVLLGLPLPAVESLIALILDLQQFSGLFGVSDPHAAWTDLAAIEVLARTSQTSDFRAVEVRAAMAFALRAILRRQQPDGGFSAEARPGASDLHTTWLRSLALATIGARWPELLANHLPSLFPSLPELGAGHTASSQAAMLLAHT